MVTLLHTADTHLGYRQYHRPEREADFREAFYEVIEAAIEENVDALVHAGDLFDSSRPGIEALSDALEGLKRLDEADIPFLSIVGNHDGTRDRQWLDVFSSLGLATRLDDEGVTVRGGDDGDGDGGDNDSDGNDDAGREHRLALYGLDHVERGRRDRLDYAFDREKAIESDATALVAHGLFEPFPNGDWDARAICRQSSVEIDAILAGDDHINRETVLPEFETLLTYPGSTERTAADQREPRGYDLVTVSPAGGIDLDFRELSARKFVYVDVEMSEGEGLDRVLDALEAEAGESDFEEAVVIVTLSGAGERVASGPIEELGLAREALAVRVNDHREHTEEGREYGEVAFVDPDSAVETRRRTLGLSEHGHEIEGLVRDGEAVPDSNLTDVVEERVHEWLDGSLEPFERTEPDPEDSVSQADSADSSEEHSTATEEHLAAGREEGDGRVANGGSSDAEPAAGSTPDGSNSAKAAGDDTGESGEPTSASDGSSSVAANGSEAEIGAEAGIEPEDGIEAGGKADADPLEDDVEGESRPEEGETETDRGSEANGENGTARTGESDGSGRAENDVEGDERDRAEEKRTTQSTLWD